MKPLKTVPSFAILTKLLQEDALRNLRVRNFVEKQSSLDFIKDLSLRVYCSRFEPRIAESVVERMVLFSQHLNLSLVIDEVEASHFPYAWVALSHFAYFADNNNKNLMRTYLHTKSHTQFIHGNPDFQSFYIDLYSPASKLCEYGIQNNLKIWEEAGFWALSPPYSKELLNYLHLPMNFKIPSAKRVVDLKLSALFENNTDWLKLGDIENRINSGLSLRQLARKISQLKGVKTMGRLKGTRYR